MDGVGFGLWGLTIVNTVGTVALVEMLLHPQTRGDWRATGACSAFAVALFHRGGRRRFAPASRQSSA